MPTRKIANLTLEFDDDGYLKDPKQWTKEVAIELAKEEGIGLTDRHWKVVDFVRKDGASSGSAPNVRRITKFGDVTTKELYELFPGGPAKKAAKISGYSKPHGCI